MIVSVVTLMFIEEAKRMTKLVCHIGCLVKETVRITVAECHECTTGVANS